MSLKHGDNVRRYCAKAERSWKCAQKRLERRMGADEAADEATPQEEQDAQSNAARRKSRRTRNTTAGCCRGRDCLQTQFASQAHAVGCGSRQQECVSAAARFAAVGCQGWQAWDQRGPSETDAPWRGLRQRAIAGSNV